MNKIDNIIQIILIYMYFQLIKNHFYKFHKNLNFNNINNYQLDFILIYIHLIKDKNLVYIYYMYFNFNKYHNFI